MTQKFAAYVQYGNNVEFLLGIKVILRRHLADNQVHSV